MEEDEGVEIGRGWGGIGRRCVGALTLGAGMRDPRALSYPAHAPLLIPHPSGLMMMMMMMMMMMDGLLVASRIGTIARGTARGRASPDLWASAFRAMSVAGGALNALRMAPALTGRVLGGFGRELRSRPPSLAAT